MTKSVILFDIDYTLLNTFLFRVDAYAGIYRKKIFQKSPYPFTLKTLRALKKYPLGIFSQEKGHIQFKKLGLSGLLPFFDKNLIIIYQDEQKGLKKAAKLLNKFHSIILIDDRPDKIENFLKTIKNSVCIRIKRGKYKNLKSKTKKFAPQFTLENLEKVPEIVQKIIENA